MTITINYNDINPISVKKLNSLNDKVYVLAMSLNSQPKIEKHLKELDLRYDKIIYDDIDIIYGNDFNQLSKKAYKNNGIIYKHDNYEYTWFKKAKYICNVPTVYSKTPNGYTREYIESKSNVLIPEMLDVILEFKNFRSDESIEQYISICKENAEQFHFEDKIAKYFGILRQFKLKSTFAHGNIHPSHFIKNTDIFLISPKKCFSYLVDLATLANLCYTSNIETNFKELQTPEVRVFQILEFSKMYSLFNDKKEFFNLLENLDEI